MSTLAPAKRFATEQQHKLLQRHALMSRDLAETKADRKARRKLAKAAHVAVAVEPEPEPAQVEPVKKRSKKVPHRLRARWARVAADASLRRAEP